MDQEPPYKWEGGKKSQAYPCAHSAHLAIHISRVPDSDKHTVTERVGDRLQGRMTEGPEGEGGLGPRCENGTICSGTGRAAGAMQGLRWGACEIGMVSGRNVGV